MIMSNMDLSYLGIYSIWKNDLGMSNFNHIEDPRH